MNKRRHRLVVSIDPPNRPPVLILQRRERAPFMNRPLRLSPLNPRVRDPKKQHAHQQPAKCATKFGPHNTLRHLNAQNTHAHPQELLERPTPPLNPLDSLSAASPFPCIPPAQTNAVLSAIDTK